MEIIRTLVAAVIGGAVASLLHAPLPWTLGPIFAVALASFLERRTYVFPLRVRNIALIALGYSMGRPFTVETGQAIAADFPLMLFATMVTVSAGIFTGWLMERRTQINLVSCLMGCVPGGLSQMVVLADEIPEADLTAVTIMQTLRMLSVVCIIPFLAVNMLPHDAGGDMAALAAGGPQQAVAFAIVAIAGALLAQRLHLPTAALLGPILATAIFVCLTGWTAPLVPDIGLDVAQVCVGSYIGSNVHLRRLSEYHGMGPVLFGGVLLVLMVSMIMGLFVSHVTTASLVTGFLSTAPGGLAEMGIVALEVGADTATMTAYQLTRLLFIMLVFPYIMRWFVRRRQRAQAKEI